MIKNESFKKNINKKQSKKIKIFYDEQAKKIGPISINISKPSDEQLEIIYTIKNHNVIVDAIPGSGKTTVALHIAKNYPDKKILLLTYNKKLRYETKCKAFAWNIRTNLTVHTFHSFCCKYYNRDKSNTIFTDDDLRQTLLQQPNKNQLHIPFIFDIIIIDECQDMTLLYYEFVTKIIKENNRNPNHKFETRLCILGDKFQCIYTHNGSDPRFITHANTIFNYDMKFNNSEWKSLKLSVSFRLPQNIANFVNNCVLGEKRIRHIEQIEQVEQVEHIEQVESNKPKHKEHKVRYLICNTMLDSNENIILKEIKNYLSLGHTFEDVFILSPSLKNNHHLNLIENLLTKEGIYIHVPTSDDAKLDEDLIKKKIVISSYHQAKGLERKIVILCGFDNSYFEFYKKDCITSICPNEIYVALTRASERLSIVHNYQKGFLPFVNQNIIRKECYVCEEIANRSNNLNENPNENNIGDNNNIVNMSATNMLRRLPKELTNKISTIIKSLKITDQNLFIKMLSSKTLQFDDLCETVNEITGVAIPSYYQFITTGKMNIFDELSKRQNNITKSITLNNKLDAATLLRISNEYCSMVSGYIHKTKQIVNYDWISIGQLKKIVAKLKTFISNDSMYEVRLGIPFYFNHITNCGEKKVLYNLNGYIDCIDHSTDTIYEFKCINSSQTNSNNNLSIEHFTQLAIYKFIFLTIRNNILKKLQKSPNKYTTEFNPGDYVIINSDVHNFTTGIIKNQIINQNKNTYQISIKKEHLFTKKQMKTFDNKYEIKSKVLIRDKNPDKDSGKNYLGMTGIIIGVYKNKYKVMLNELFTYTDNQLINKTKLEKDFQVAMQPQFVFVERVPKFKLMNLLTCEVHELLNNSSELLQIINLLISKDQNAFISKSTHEFLNMINIIKSKYFPTHIAYEKNRKKNIIIEKSSNGRKLKLTIIKPKILIAQ